MVQRFNNPDRVVFSEDEQKEFDLPEVLSPVEAVSVALRFKRLAGCCADGANEQDASTAASLNLRRQLNRQANQLGEMAQKLFDVCPDPDINLQALSWAS